MFNTMSGPKTSVSGEGPSARLRAVREVEGYRQLAATVDGLLALDARLADLEARFGCGGFEPLAKLPSSDDLNITDGSPRAMEAAMLIGAISRRAQLRLGVLETVVLAELLQHAGPCGSEAPVLPHHPHRTEPVSANSAQARVSADQPRDPALVVVQPMEPSGRPANDRRRSR